MRVNRATALTWAVSQAVGVRKRDRDLAVSRSKKRFTYPQPLASAHFEHLPKVKSMLVILTSQRDRAHW